MNRIPPESFEATYRVNVDPWHFSCSPYEQRRYNLTTAALLRWRYERAFEPGCAIGELTRRLATRCDQVEACDASPTVVAEARRRCRSWPNVHIEVADVPAEWPEGRFDLVVLSEIGYYFDLDGLAELRDRAIESLDDGGTLVAVHWRGTSPDILLRGDEVHACLRRGQGLVPGGCYSDAGFVLDVWERR
jgi:protein-L-isoaspartate O-methyltransferase